MRDKQSTLNEKLKRCLEKMILIDLANKLIIQFTSHLSLDIFPHGLQCIMRCVTRCDSEKTILLNNFNLRFYFVTPLPLLTLVIDFFYYTALSAA